LTSVMNNDDLLAKLSKGVEAILNLAGDQLNSASETETEFSCQAYPAIKDLGQTINDLKEYSELFSIRLNYEVQTIKGTASLSPNGLLIEEFKDDPELSPPDLELEGMRLYQSMSGQLSPLRMQIDPARLSKDLVRLEKSGASLTLVLRVSIGKDKLIDLFQLPKNVRLIFYVETNKFLDSFHFGNIVNLSRTLVPNNEDTLVFLLGDAHGMASGPNIRVLGRDNWVGNKIGFTATDIDRNKILATIDFSSSESNWENFSAKITPYHFFIQDGKEIAPQLSYAFENIRNNLAIAYLANRVQTSDDKVICEFKGYKRVQVVCPTPTTGKTTLGIFKLFAWVFDNPSSDKLGIVQQLITLQLGDDSIINSTFLIEKAGDILETAKSNFQVFLNRSVELYFDKRLKVSEFLQGFSEEIGINVSTLSSELLDNLYKTIGVVIGDAIAIIINPQYTKQVIFYTACLYFLYIVLTIVIKGGTYWRFANQTIDYRNNINHLSDVLTAGEIKRLEGTSFSRSRFMFLITYSFTILVYAFLGLCSYWIISFTKPY